jgi:integrase
MAGDGNGGALLERNPCAGFPIPAEVSPRRPRLAEDRFQAMLAVADEVHPEFRLALVLSNETGHRISSIRQLWWSDILWDANEVRWRGETDKQGMAHATPLTSAARAELETARDRSGAIGDVWVFPEERRTASTRSPMPRSRHTFKNWWAKAEALAELPHTERWGWHSLRRKFASELRHAPLRDVCDLGGWKSAATVLACYQTPDPVSVRHALASRSEGFSSGESGRVRQVSSHTAKSSERTACDHANNLKQLRDLQ